MKHTILAIPALALGLAFSLVAADVIPGGTQVAVRTDQRIHLSNADGRVYTGTVADDVTDNNGNVVINRGSRAELIARRVNGNDMALDLDSITVGNRRYSVEASEDIRGGNRREGLGGNARTGKYVGGGAVLGTLLGAIAGGGRGAAIGAAAGAGAGAGTQVLTRGRRVDVPSESVLTFRLERPLSISERDLGHDRDGRHYHDRY
ncbi:MAG: hypothetical protein M3Z09_00455 [Acidobacteriota bacterium]|nr:hypothetical protein [Acidobacteriota bacterium]